MSEGNTLKEEKTVCDWAKRPQCRTTVGEIYLYKQQRLANHQTPPWSLETFFCCSLGSKTYNCKAAHLKGWLGVWWAGGIPLSEAERQNWITDYSKASADLDSTFTLRQPRTKGRYLTGKLLKQEVGSLWETRGNFGMSRWALTCGILSVQHRRALKWKWRRRR